MKVKAPALFPLLRSETQGEVLAALELSERGETAADLARHVDASLPTVTRELARLAVEDYQRRDARDLVLLPKRRLELALGVGKCEPRLLAEVRVEVRLLTVARDEDYLEALARRHEALVDLGQLRSEAAAGRAPVRREVERYSLFSLERLSGRDDAVLGLERLA